MEYLFDYLLFLAKAITVLVAIVLVASMLASMQFRRPQIEPGRIEVRCLNNRLREFKRVLRQSFTHPSQVKKLLKREAKEDKAEGKRQRDAGDRPRTFVLTFDGDLQASRVDRLRNEVTAVLTSARPEDEVVVRIESSGGMVHSYGLAASQLERVKQHGIRLTAAVDKVAASGGYLVASVADRIIAAPFALVGSIGVVAQVPNVHRFLKNRDIDFEVLTAGEHKRTLTVFGENTEQGRRKFLEELEDVHALFRDFVSTNRPQVNVSEVATGEAWYGRRAIERKLVDELKTSDEYLMRACEQADVYEVRWIEHRRPLERLAGQLTRAMASAWARLSSRGFGL
jgi:serine protease SohB